jgi:hypothetical protein
VFRAIFDSIGYLGGVTGFIGINKTSIYFEAKSDFCAYKNRHK